MPTYMQSYRQEQPDYLTKLSESLNSFAPQVGASASASDQRLRDDCEDYADDAA